MLNANGQAHPHGLRFTVSFLTRLAVTAVVLAAALLVATPVTLHRSVPMRRESAPLLPALAPSTADSIVGAVRRTVSQSESERARRGPLRIVIRTAKQGSPAWVTVDGVEGGPHWYRVERRKTFWRRSDRWVAAHVPPLESATTRPSTVGQRRVPSVQARKQPPPNNAVLNFADTFTVPRRPDGHCDWAKTPARPGKPGSSSYLGEVRAKDCWGVVYNVTFPPESNLRMTTSTTISLPSHVWEGPDTLTGRGRQARDIANAASAVIPRGARVWLIDITDDTVATVVTFRPGSTTTRYGYPFRKRGMTWVLSGKPYTQEFAPQPPRRSHQ